MLRGLEEVERDLAAKRIPFCLLAGAPKTVLPEFLNSRSAGLLMTDFHPLKIKQAWKQDVARRISIPLHEVDAHNIVPCWIASPKQEYGAYTLRPELRRLLPAYLSELPVAIQTDGLDRLPRPAGARRSGVLLLMIRLGKYAGPGRVSGPHSMLSAGSSRTGSTIR
jgi:deoxyribodipyrimidine photolyase